MIKERPDRLTDLGTRSWWEALKRAVGGFRSNNLTDGAAALTYFGMLAIFPALIILISIVGLAGDSATQSLLDNVGALSPGPAQEILRGAIEQIAGNQGAAGAAFLISLAVALWSASGYIGNFRRAANVVYEVSEGRPFWKRRLLQLAITLLLLLVVALIAIAVVLSGSLAEQAGNVFGLGDTTLTVWGLVKWPAIAVVMTGMLALLYYVAPNVRHQGLRGVAPGAVVGMLLWLAASASFSLYVDNFGFYNKTYGSLAGVIVFLVWLWLSNIAALLGLELNAELERGRDGTRDPMGRCVDP